ncbi:DinB family protein [Chryseolinea sp. T2]|uniref:DinB family protein n=1 Tax=Chryseolinea sp. T2 TaxID=3129255 RepID=UPI0030785665
MSTRTEIPESVKVSATLRRLIADHLVQLQQIDDEAFSAKPNPQKWSKKEILGHLIDSAQNNLRRFITSQYEAEPPHIVYNQDFWVEANQYGHTSAQELILLWKLLNDRIAVVLENLTTESNKKLCNTGKDSQALNPLSFLAKDYLNHTEHHLRQILN